MRNLFANACIALCLLTCVEHHDEVCGMQPFVNDVINISPRKARSIVRISFSKDDQREHKAFFKKLQEGQLDFISKEETSLSLRVYTLRFDVFQDALRQESADFQERLRNIVRGDVIRIEDNPSIYSIYYRLADYGIFHMTGKMDDKRRLYSLMIDHLPLVVQPNGEIHINRNNFDLLDNLGDQAEELKWMLYYVKAKNYVVFGDDKAIYID